MEPSQSDQGDPDILTTEKYYINGSNNIPNGKERRISFYQRNIYHPINMANRGNLINTIKVIQQNVLKWTFARWNELSNIYMRHNPEVILLNNTGVKENNIIKIFQYNVYQWNVRNEDYAGVAIAVRRDVRH